MARQPAATRFKWVRFPPASLGVGLAADLPGYHATLGNTIAISVRRDHEGAWGRLPAMSRMSWLPDVARFGGARLGRLRRSPARMTWTTKSITS